MQGHVPVRLIQNLLCECRICQRDRRNMEQGLISKQTKKKKRIYIYEVLLRKVKIEFKKTGQAALDEENTKF